MLVTALLSLLAGVLTVLAPCVLPFLPVIVGGSLGHGSRRRPYLIAGSLVVSLLLFTLLLKASTAFLNIDPKVWAIGSGSLVVLLGLVMLFPGVWARIAAAVKLDNAHQLLDKARGHRSETLGAVLTGAALGPVFSSCSPTYAWVIATVLPASPSVGMFYLGVYCIGMAGALLAISLLGRRLIDRLGWAANPRGWFQRVVAVLFIIVGVFVATGWDKQFQAWAVDKFPSLVAFEEGLIPSAEQAIPRQAGEGELPNPTPAPELQGITAWVGSDPLTLAELRGKVVLVDFWTYSCINCVRTQPYLNAWYDRYHDAGFEIIGVHAPEFAFEKVPENVAKAVADARIKYPVALDNDFATWRAYNNRYWPAKYLIDAEGRVRWVHFGEGHYDEAEAKIRELLGEGGDKAVVSDETLQHTPGQSPETYLGTDRAAGDDSGLRGGDHDYGAATDPRETSHWTLGGPWSADGESITALSDGAQLRYRFSGQEMYLVMDGPAGARVRVEVEGGIAPGGADVIGEEVTIDGARMYRLVRLPEATGGTTVTLTFDEGVRANAFTFG
ncbi:cytochrome c biogenesis protein DipZ [Arachnia propionica]|uniref:Cytochrome c biogenesis protein DipZ n=1 Tax=Arachnia propionica TaxID=1750 RepID=A0A3P1T668_9ACTN|nr:redoxin family protein [Arachnia propionica]MDO5083410.1 redoxin family protein [Arachnia propionica]RRD04854.1 cytochrome c biogenesis protein DipZ [Arachnia propionica]